MKAGRNLVVAATTVLALSIVQAAEASCGQPPAVPRAIERAEVVFVGTAVAVENNDRTATFRVESVWKGTVDETVVVHGGPKASLKGGERVWTSIDRTYAQGTRYLVLPAGRSGDVLLDACTSTQPYTSQLAALRPTEAHPPLADGGGFIAPGADGDGAGPAAWILLAVLAAAGAALAGAFAWQRLRARPS
jgi:hypothetical protein